jgi:hypothetical protein
MIIAKTWGSFGSSQARMKWFERLDCLAFFLFIALGIRYQVRLLKYIEWGDESETIVASKMIAAGRSLYSEIFNHHGPLTFLPGVLLETFGNYGIAAHRLPIALLQVLALASIYFSPILKAESIKRCYTVAAGTVMLLYFPEIYGHTYMYQVLAGLMLIVILTQYTIPALLIKESVSTWRVALGNSLICSLPFLAITYAPVAILLFFASVGPNFRKTAIAFVLLGVSANFVLLLCIGSVSGYFAFHIYLNSSILPAYNGGQSGGQLVYAAFSQMTSDVAQFTMLVALVVAVAGLASSEIGAPWRSLFVGLGLSTLLMRGGGFQGLPYFYAMLAIPLVFFFRRIELALNARVIALVFSLVCVLKISLLFPDDRQRLKEKRIPEATEFSQVARTFTENGDEIIAYTFQNIQYILADRLPASGHFFYLPWQEKYNENPMFGIMIDACKDIRERRPKVLLIDKWKVWEKYPWNSYAACVQEVIDAAYVKMSNRNYYIRKDLVADEVGLTLDVSGVAVLPNEGVGASNTVKILMTSHHINAGVALKRIGVMLTSGQTAGRKEAVLHMTGADGDDFVQKFSLNVNAGGGYQYFSVGSKKYSSAYIENDAGLMFGTFEANHLDGKKLTCIIYEYVDGRKSLTPGCPFY